MNVRLSLETNSIFGRTPIDIKAEHNLTETVSVGAVLILILEYKISLICHVQKIRCRGNELASHFHTRKIS